MIARVYVHGGVSGSPDIEPGDLSKAVAAGLAADRSLDAVEAAVRALEDNPELNAGTGAVLNRNGRLELDAGICDGSTGRFGGVGVVSVRNPISLARRVMTDTPHVLMVGAGAGELGRDMEAAPIVSSQTRRWEEARDAGTLTDEAFGHPASVDTVGAVALVDGELAAGSSTGGVFAKRAGRVGDAAIFGAGVYASDGAAVVGTGVGELFLESLACFRVGALIETGLSPADACRRVIETVVARFALPVGLLALDAQGHVGAAYHGAIWHVHGPEGPFGPEHVDAIAP